MGLEGSLLTRDHQLPLFEEEEIVKLVKILIPLLLVSCGQTEETDKHTPSDPILLTGKATNVDELPSCVPNLHRVKVLTTDRNLEYTCIALENQSYWRPDPIREDQIRLIDNIWKTELCISRPNAIDPGEPIYFSAEFIFTESTGTFKEAIYSTSDCEEVISEREFSHSYSMVLSGVNFHLNDSESTLGINILSDDSFDLIGGGPEDIFYDVEFFKH